MMFLERYDDVMVFGVLLSQLVRCAISRWPYSGAGKPPIYGDYEAQRHWMEITVNLPVKEWYSQTSQNDLQYWGLDYPPLTAYQSLLFGYAARAYNKEWVQLNTSRGFESYEHQIFMRSTVILADIVCFLIPCILYWSLIPRPAKLRDKAIAASLTMLYPGFILIDHGHFQYNCVCLGFTLAAILCFLKSRDFLGSAFFSLAIHYKQMSLYYAFPIFFYLLGSCFRLNMRNGLLKFLKLGSIVIVTSVICWAPFLTSYDTFIEVVNRLFPFDRGLFEDKVANIWYALSVIVKLKNIFSTASLVRLSGFATLIGVLPSSVHLLYNPSVNNLRLAVVNSSMVFFLLSYQVHEKTILFVALPVLLLIEDHPFVCSWFAMISTFSLVPLLAKDVLLIPYAALSAMFFTGVLRGYNGLGLSLSDHSRRLKTVAFVVSLLGCQLLTVAMFQVKSPKRYPHLHELLNCIFCCLHFIGFCIYFHWLQFTSMPKKLQRMPKSKAKLS